MHRRHFLQTGTRWLSAAVLPLWLADGRAQTTAPATPSAEVALRHVGPAQPFDFAVLKGQARALAAAPFTGTRQALPASVAALDWDQWQSIRFRDDHSLWAGTGLRFQARFAHLGYRLDEPVRIYQVEDGRAQQIAYDVALFDYATTGLDARRLPAELGFGGFRLLFHTDWSRDLVSFQGASYFRAVDGGRQFGLSARGLALGTGLGTDEEFPRFTAYYLERPLAESNRVRVYALLDSPSVAGAYRFDIEVGDTLKMEVDAALYPRVPLTQVGIAPGTSMFFYAKNDRRMAVDWRPEIHDSDGLQIWTGEGEWIWRPLINPRAVQINTHMTERPRGFGLMQRERRFDQYQDDGVFYEKRPSLWVEPRNDWGKGAVALVEIPTADETLDNIVAFWSPADPLQPGREALFAYRLYWCREMPVAMNVATVRATRTGVGGIVGQKRRYFSWRFVVDFAGGDLSLLGEKARIEPRIWASRGKIEIASARPLASINGWRAMFDLVPDESAAPINLRLFLAVEGQAMTETWLYQYAPPPLDQRVL